MKIAELKAGTSNVSVVGTVASKDEPREVVTKYGKRLQVANIVLKDESGQIAMSLWGADINAVNAGDKVEITNGFVNEFRGNPQLSTGKFGKIKVLEKGAGGGSAESSEDEAAPAEDFDEM